MTAAEGEKVEFDPDVVGHDHLAHRQSLRVEESVAQGASDPAILKTLSSKRSVEIVSQAWNWL